MNKTKLPKDWKIVNLKSIADSIQYGYTESSSKVEIGPKFLRITDIQENKVNWESVPYCKIDEQSKSKYLLKDGDLVFARTGATVGKSFLIKGKIPEAVFASYLIRVRVNLVINEKYLSYFFQSPEYWKQITNDQVGTGQPNVNGTKLGLLKIVIAPLETQQAIVSKIEELFSELDKGIEDLKTAQLQLKTYRQSVLKWAFEGKLTNENVNVSIIPFGSIIKVVSGNTPKGLENISNIGNYQFYKVSDMNLEGNEIEMRTSKFNLSIQDIEKLKIKLYPKGTVIFPKRGGAILTNKKRKLSEESSFDLNVMGALPNQKVDANYLFYWFQKLDLGKICDGSNIPQINNKNIEPLDFEICNIEEQHLIVQEIESRLSVADKMEESIAQSLQQAEASRQSILKKAFSGELV